MALVFLLSGCWARFLWGGQVVAQRGRRKGDKQLEKSQVIWHLIVCKGIRIGNVKGL